VERERKAREVAPGPVEANSTVPVTVLILILERVDVDEYKVFKVERTASKRQVRGLDTTSTEYVVAKGGGWKG
jgi:hypothetical protein